MKVANEKASKNVTLRGNVPKTTVSNCIIFFAVQQIFLSTFLLLLIDFHFFLVINVFV